nr:hypothetical protein [Tanacetum cinerariifolium]
LCTRLQRQQAKMASKINAQEFEISQLKTRVKLLEDREGGGIARSGEDAPIKGRSLDEGEEAAEEKSTERASDDTEEMVTVLTSLDAASILTSGVSISISPVTEVSIVEVPTGSGSIPTASPPDTGVPTGSDVVPTASPIFTTATESTPYTRRKDEPASPLGDESQGEACPTDPDFEADQDRANIAKTSTLPNNSTPRVTSLATDEGNMQHKLNKLIDLCTRLQRQQAKMASKINAQEFEISQLKTRG